MPVRRLLGPLWVAAVAAAALLVTAPPAGAAPGLVKLKVTVDAVSALDCFEGSFLGACLGEADFYAVVTIDGHEFPQSDAVDDENNADPNPDWVFERDVDITRGPAAVSIEIREEDGEFRLGDDHADIDPTNGGNTSNLDLRVRLSPTCEVSGDATIPTERCGLFEVSSGTADNNKAKIRYKVEVIDPDTDGDTLPDSWENGGLDVDGNGSIEVDLPGMGANPGRSDLFLELDCLVDNDGTADDHTHCPVQGAVRTVVQAFADAPVSNVDGSTGIQLHIDIGSLYGHAPNTDTDVARALAPAVSVSGSFGNYGGGGSQIGEAGNQIVDWDGATGSPATNFYSLKGAPGNNFDSNRALAFRYGLFVHQVNARAASNDCTSGWAEGGALAGGSSPGNDLIVSLGGTSAPPGPAACWGAVGGQSVGTPNQQAGTLMHEFGHTLGLDHGGGDTFNNKPNYFSVMNYGIGSGPVVSATIQMCAVPALGGSPGGCDFSRVVLNTLNEVLPPGQDECADIGLGLGGFDWNGGGQSGATCTPSSANVSTNINGDFNDPNNNGTQDPGETQILSALPGFNDWTNIRYNFRAASNFANGVVPPFPGEADPATLAALRARLAAAVRPVLAVDKTGPADAIPGDTLDYDLSLSNPGRGPALRSILTDTKPDATQVAFDLGLATVGSSFQRSASYAVPCITRDGAVLTNVASATAEDMLGNAIAGSDSVSTTIHAPVLTLSKTATSTVRAGEAITYRLTYENTGTGAATNVVITDTVPAGVYYSTALDLGAGPKPTSITLNPDGTRTLVWNVGALGGASGPRTIEFTARPTLLALGGTLYTNNASLAFTNANGCVFADVTASASTTISVVPPSRNPLTLGYWRNHAEEWTAEIRARIQATDQRYDGIDGTAADGELGMLEVAAMYAPDGNQPKVLQMQLLSVYFNLATRRINAGTGIDSRAATALGIANVRDAALYAQATLALPVDSSTRSRYDAINGILDDINNNKRLVF